MTHKNKQGNSMKNRFSITVKNENFIRDIDGLIAGKRFSSKQEIINKCIEIALPLLAEGKANKAEKEKADVSIDALKKQSAIIRDVAVVCNITFNLVQSLFTERALSLEGLVTNATDLKNGVYENLPEHYQDVLAELMKI